MATLSQAFQYCALIVAIAVPVLCQNQRAVLYDQYNGEGSYVTIPEDYIDDLSRINWDNRVRSVCVTGMWVTIYLLISKYPESFWMNVKLVCGRIFNKNLANNSMNFDSSRWLFYQDARYNTEYPRGVEYVFGRDNYCANIRTIAGTISSVRFAGAPRDYREDTFTLYAGDWFQGDEEYTFVELPNINLRDNHKSIIITGNSHWTVFDVPNYQGNSICLQVPEPGNSTPSFLSDLEQLDPVIPHGSIRSVRKGCMGKSNYTLSSFARTNTRSTFVPSATFTKLN